MNRRSLSLSDFVGRDDPEATEAVFDLLGTLDSDELVRLIVAMRFAVMDAEDTDVACGDVDRVITDALRLRAVKEWRP